MGAGQDKERIERLEQQQEAMMKENAALAKRLAEEQEKHSREQAAMMEQMAKLMLVAILANNQASSGKTKEPLEIEGVKYTPVEELGEGGFGKVYKAKVTGTNRMVAIKVMKNSPLIQKEVENEIRFLKVMKKVQVNPHPIIEFYGSKITSECIFIAMELAHRDLLNFWFEDMKNQSRDEKFVFGLIIIIYALRALAFLEKLNIVHGDIKPQNMVMVQCGKTIAVKLIDFGTVEKMNTWRAAKTVAADKAYTNFFAAPEFIRRSADGSSARRLHKKSDAWAAGVMFYILFLEKLPWHDDREYEDFVQNPRSRDITVPSAGGYKPIIELLLKKNPDERASAKETLLQIKAHPVLGLIVASIEETFYPADDVCHIRVSEEIRQELANCATAQRRAHILDSASDSSSRGTTGGHRRSCRYGVDCYRKNPYHREEFAHPGDPDYHEGACDTKSACRYGGQCYRTNNKEHLAKYSHH